MTNRNKAPISPRAFVLVCFMMLAALGVFIADQAHSASKKPLIEPVIIKPDAGVLMDVQAQQILYDAKTEIATATGDIVKVLYGPYTLTAKKITHDRLKDTVVAEGNVELHEPNGNVAQADRLELRQGFKQIFAQHVTALLTDNATLTAKYVSRREDGITIYENASYTLCKDCKLLGDAPAWQLFSKSTKHDSNKKILVHKNAHLRIGGVPILWSPYWEQPDPSVKRRTGLLFPKYKVGDAFGIGVITPIFLNLAPNYDLTLQPMWMTKQRHLDDVEWRHRLASGTYSIRGMHIMQKELNEKGRTPNAKSRTRFGLITYGDFSGADGWKYGWNAAAENDVDFFRDYQLDGRDLIESKLYVSRLQGRNYVNMQALNYYTTVKDEQQKYFPRLLPYINSSYIFEQPILGGEFGFDTSSYALYRDLESSPFTDVNHGKRQLRVSSTMHWQRKMISQMGQVITPFFELRSDLYVNKRLPGRLSSAPFGADPPYGQKTTFRAKPLAGLDVRWPFIGATGKGRSIITPVLQLMTAPNESKRSDIGNEDAISLNFDTSNLFLHDKFVGLDRYQGGTRVNAGLIYHYMADNGASARFAFGQAYHISGRNSFAAGSGLNKKYSDFVGSFVLQPLENIRLSYQIRLANDFSSINAQEAALNLNVDRLSATMGYSDVKEAPLYGRPILSQQAWINASFKLNSSLLLFGGARYDLKGNRFMNRSAGIQFDCDCMNAKLYYVDSRSTDPGAKRDKRIVFSVELTSLFATSISSELSKK